ncbi:MAG: hypothetical protein WCP21_12290, partial [Armatimonadota bacterium]
LRRALDMAATIKDYSADVNVTVDMPNVKMPERRAKVYFKRPDKVAIDSKGIVMIPKKALVPGNLGAQLGKDAQVTLAGTKVQAGVPLYFLKVTPTASSHANDRILFWVRGDRWTVERMEAQSGGKQQLTVTWEYQLVSGKHWMPRRLVATLPPGGSVSRHMPPRPPEEKPSNKPGVITVTFSNVRVNTGLSDSLFVDHTQEKSK